MTMDIKDNITAANIRYLLAVSQLDRGRGVRCMDVADLLNVSKPSVHAMIEKMKALSLVQKGDRCRVCLTQEGRKAAERYEKYYSIVSEQLREIMPDSSDVRGATFAFIAQASAEDLEGMCKEAQKRNGGCSGADSSDTTGMED